MPVGEFCIVLLSCFLGRNAYMERTRIHKLATVGCLAALSSVLMLLDFPIGLIPGFIKFDFSDVPALIAAFAVGPVWGCAVAMIKNLINVIVSQSAGIGELANFVISVSLVLPAGAIYKKLSSKKGSKALLLACIAGGASMTVMSIPMNYFVVFPFYSVAYGTAMDSIIMAFKKIYPFINGLLDTVIVIMAPFNMLKAAVNCTIAAIVYKRIIPIFKRTV